MCRRRKVLNKNNKKKKEKIKVLVKKKPEFNFITGVAFLKLCCLVSI